MAAGNSVPVRDFGAAGAGIVAALDLDTARSAAALAADGVPHRRCDGPAAMRAAAEAAKIALTERLDDLLAMPGLELVVKGDQPALLISLVGWAGTLGLPIAAAGRSSEYDDVFDPAAGRTRWLSEEVASPGLARLMELGPDPAATIAARAAGPLGRCA